MRRTKMMTIGFILIMVGIQLNVVDSFELTPRFSNLLSEHGGVPIQESPTNNYSPYQQTSFSSNPGAEPYMINQMISQAKVIRHPSWLCWPFIFCGTVLVLQGLIRRD